MLDLPAVRRVWQFLIETLRDGGEEELAQAVAASGDAAKQQL
ncbi:hypothetical protein [Nannocystis sp. SCPEA4]|nr:hypothetical protein [Nannocystis sp. SCPEA4]MCY1061802.1 hypothetical protein [Nannocystis sp. SCPEA4]